MGRNKLMVLCLPGSLRKHLFSSLCSTLRLEKYWAEHLLAGVCDPGCFNQLISIFHIFSQNNNFLHFLLRLPCWILHPDAPRILPDPVGWQTCLGKWRKYYWLQPWTWLPAISGQQAYWVHSHLVQERPIQWKLEALGVKTAAVSECEYGRNDIVKF